LAPFFVLVIAVLLLHSGTVLALEPMRTGANSLDIMVTTITQRKPAPVSVVRPYSQRSQLPKPIHLEGKAQATPRQAAPSPDLRKKATGPAPTPIAANAIASPFSPQPKRPLSLKAFTEPPKAFPAVGGPKQPAVGPRPQVKAKALFCIDCAANKVVLAQNISEPLPIASITKLLTAMTIVEEMDLEKVLEVPADIVEVERHKVGIRPGDLFTVKDLLHGMLIESGNDCAETLARAYPKGGRDGFMAEMNRRAVEMGASRTMLFTPSGLDMKITLGRKDGRNLDARRPNIATAEDVAKIAKQAFKNPLIARISSMKTYTMRTRNVVPRDYPLVSNDRLLTKNLPVAGAKTGFTNMAGKCIVALFKDEKAEHMVVVLNSAQHFKAAEKIYRWASRTF
jgi:D-alanyl-D-alanine carboxypeptidase